MKKFNSLIKKGTRVLISGNWEVVTSLNENKNLITVRGLAGSFQRGHISKFSNSSFLSSTAQAVVNELTRDGYDMAQVKDAMCDGEYLATAGVSREVAEEIYNS